MQAEMRALIVAYMVGSLSQLLMVVIQLRFPCNYWYLVGDLTKYPVSVQFDILSIPSYTF